MKGNRTFEIECGTRADGADKNEYPMAISSEAEVERWFGIEVLSHEKKSIDLRRLKGGRHPLLVEHDRNRKAGVIFSPELGDDKKLRVMARFGNSSFAQEIRQNVDDKIDTLVSVGYLIHEVIEEKADRASGDVKRRTLTGEEFEREMRSQYGEQFYRAGPCAARGKASSEQEIPRYIVTRWEPFEASLVAIPADIDVGVGRSAASDPPEPQAPVSPTPPTTRSPVQTMEPNPNPNPNPTPTGTEVERARSAAILKMAEQYAGYVTSAITSEAIRSGHTVEQFREKIMEAITTRHVDTRSSPAHLGLEKKDAQRYSLARAIGAVISGDWKQAGLEAECSQAVARALGAQPSGFFMPYDAFHRDFTVTAPTEAGNLVPTDLRADMFADVLRNQLVAAQLGVRFLFGLTSNLEIPKKTVAGSISRVTEIQALTETQPTTAKVSLSPKRLGAFTEYSKQAIIQSALAVEPLIRQDLLDGIAVDLQDQWYNGSGVAPNMRGIRNTSGIGSVVGGANGANFIWTHAVGLESACANVNAEPDRLAGYLINTKTRGTTKTTQKAANLPFMWDGGPQPLNGYRVGVSNTVPSNLVKGASGAVCSSVGFSSDWSQSIVGLFGAPDIVVDPFTLASTGMVRITIQQFADHVVRLAACFATMEDALTP
jgi:HK97 family phage major capsid protein